MEPDDETIDPLLQLPSVPHKRVFTVQVLGYGTETVEAHGLVFDNGNAIFIEMSPTGHQTVLEAYAAGQWAFIKLVQTDGPRH